MVSELSYCPQGGWLVSEAPVPSDPSDHWTHGVGDVFGCNHLTCARCGALVRSAPNRKPARKLGKKQLEALADEADWSTSSLLAKTYFARLYACRCTSFLENARRLVQDPDHDALDLQLPWACAGHPAPTLPVLVEGATLESDTDWVGLVGSVFAGQGPPGDHVGWSELPASWLGRLYHRLRGLPESVALSRVIADGLASERPEDVGAALLFFRWWPHAAGSERVVELADRRGGTTVFPCPLRDTSTPESPATTLAAQARASETVEERVLPHLRAAAVSVDPDLVGAGRFAPLVQGLVRHDGEWSAKHAAEVAAGSPDRADTLLRALRDLERDELVVVAGKVLLNDGGYEDAVRAFLDSAFSKQRAFAPVLSGSLSSPA